MKKLIGTIAAMGLLLPVAAFASINVDNILFSGSGSVTVAADATVNADVYVTNDSANDVESLFIKVPNSGGATEQGICYDVADQVGTSPVNGWVIPVNLKVPHNNGTWDVVVSTHGTNGDAADNICSTSADDTSTFTGRVTVTGGGTPSSGGTGTTSQWDTILASLQAILLKLTPTTPTPPASSTKCTALQSKMLGTQMNVYNQANVQLQGFLLSEGQSIPALTAGASFGYFGPQTASALTSFKAMNQCL